MHIFLGKLGNNMSGVQHRALQFAGRPRHLPLCQVNALSFPHCLVRGKTLLVCSPRHSQPLAPLKPAASQHSFPPAHARPVLSFHQRQGTAADLVADSSSGNPCFDGESLACCKSADDHCCFVAIMPFPSFAFTTFSSSHTVFNLFNQLSRPKAALRAWVLLPLHGPQLHDDWYVALLQSRPLIACNNVMGDPCCCSGVQPVAVIPSLSTECNMADWCLV